MVPIRLLAERNTRHLAARQPRVRDREAIGGERIRFSPTILPPYARRTKSLEVLIPILYLKGISTGDFEEALGRQVAIAPAGVLVDPSLLQPRNRRSG